MTLRLAKRPGLLPLALGVLGLAAVVVLLPFSGDSDTLAGFVAAYVLVLLPTGSLLYGLLVLAADSPVPKLLLLGVVAGTVGVATTYLGGRPEKLVEGPAPEPLALLFFADVLRMCAAGCLGLAFARRVTSPGVALLIAGLATAADLFSVFAGPTKALVERDAPTLDYSDLRLPSGLRPGRRRLHLPGPLLRRSPPSERFATLYHSEPRVHRRAARHARGLPPGDRPSRPPVHRPLVHPRERYSSATPLYRSLLSQ